MNKPVHPLITRILASVALATHAVNAQVLFYEDFESPNIVEYAEGSSPSGWVRAVGGFGTDYHGMVDKSTGDFQASDPNTQAYAFRYTAGAKLHTGEDVIGPVAGDATVTVSFDAQADLAQDPGLYYTAKLIAYDRGADLTVSPDSAGDQYVLQTVTGSVANDGLFHNISMSYTIDPVADAAVIGKQLGVVFYDNWDGGGGVASAVVDNVQVSVAHSNTTTAPGILYTEPVDNAAAVVVNAPLRVAFSKPVSLGTGNITIRNLTDAVDIVIPATDPRLSTQGYYLNIDSSKDLLVGKSYAVQIDPTAIVDGDGLSFVGIADDVTWNFTTVENPLKLALLELRDHVNSVTTLTEQQIADHRANIIAYKSYLDFDSGYVSDAFGLVTDYDAVHGALFIARSHFDRYNPIGATDPLGDQLDWTMFQVMQSIMDEVYGTQENLAAYESLMSGYKFTSADNFPGVALPPADPNNSYTVKVSTSFGESFGTDLVNESVDARKPTGAYVAPGTVVTVTVPPSLVGKSYKLRIGAHSWDYEERDRRWVKRLDRATHLYPIDSTTLTAISPYGGGVYIEVPRGSAGGVEDITIVGAIRAPYFSAKSFHQTTNAEWIASERNHPAPWADFQSEKFQLQVPRTWIYNLDDAQAVIDRWDEACDSMNDLLGHPRIQGKETLYFQPDVINRSSVQAPGYPAVNQSTQPMSDQGGANNHYYLFGPAIEQNSETEMHEQGHAFKFDKFDGESESTVNFLYPTLMHRYHGWSIDHAHARSLGFGLYHSIDHTAIAWMTSFNFSPREVEMHSSEKAYQLKGHAKFADIVRLFGYEGLEQFWYSIQLNKENGEAYPTGDDELMVRLCESVGADVRPLLHFWGIFPQDAAAVQSAITAAGLTPSPELYRLLTHYKSIVPANNPEFQAFAYNWWGGIPNPAGNWTESEHGRQWDATDQATPNGKTVERPNGEIFDEAASAQVQARVQAIIDLYFPSGDPAPGFAPVPVPSTMAFAKAPAGLYADSVTMTAIAASDLNGPVEYYFENTTTGANSGWTTSNVWTNLGLTGGASYSFRVKARNTLLNETSWSAAAIGAAGDSGLAVAAPALARAGITDDLGSGNAVVLSPVTYTVSFSQDMDASTVTAADFSNVGSAPVTIDSVVESSPGVFSVVVTPSASGTLQLQVGSGVLDAVGTAMTGGSVTDDIIHVVMDQMVSVPDVVGLQQSAAQSQIEAASLVVGTVTLQNSETIPAGEVISQSPVGGNSAAAGSAVDLVVSAGPVDTTAPTVASFDPVDGSTDVAVASNLTVTFDEAVVAGSGNITLKNLSNSTQEVISITDGTQVTISGLTLTINPAADLLHSKDYAVQIDATALEDLAGNAFAGIADDVTWNFTTVAPTQMAEVWTEDFESPDVAAYVKGQLPDNGRWVGSSSVSGFGWDQKGITDKAGLDFSAPDPNHQAFAFRYTNSHLVTADGVIGTVTDGKTYRVTFDVVRDDGKNAGTPFTVEFVAYDVAANRGDKTVGTVLATLSGDAPSDGSFGNYSLELLVDAATHAAELGMDIGVRFIGASTSAIIDNVLVEEGEPGASDTTPPTLLGIVDDAAGGPVIENTPVAYTVSFDEDMDASTVDASDFGNAGSAPIVVGAVTELSPGVFSVAVTPTAVGILQLQVNAGAVLADVAGNALDTASALLDDTTITVQVTPDTTPPTLADIVDDAAGGPVTENTPVTYTVSFNEDMDAATVDASDFGNAGSAPIGIGSISETSPGVFSVGVTPTAAGSLQLQVKAGAVLADVSGNALDTTSAILDDTTITVEVQVGGGEVFADDFEPGANPYGGTTPDVATYTLANTSKQANTSLWVKSSSGFGSDRSGLVDETENGGLSFTDPAGTQAYGFRYTNSGVTTAEGLIGALVSGTTIDVGFDVVVDGFNAGDAYEALLVLFDPAATRNAVEYAEKGTAAVLARATGTVANDGNYHTIALSYTVGDPVIDNDGDGGLADTAWLASLLGKDIALRIKGATNHCIIDNVSVSVNGSGGGGDTTPPTLAGSDIEDDAAGGPVVENTLVTYTVTFSEDMDAASVTSADFANAGTAPVSIGTVSEASPGVFSVLVTPTAAGSLQLQVPAGAVLTDTSGNALDTTAAIVDDTLVTVDVGGDTTPPTLAGSDIVDDAAGGPVVENTLVTYTVTFSEDMDAASVTSADFANAGTAPVSVGTVSQTSPGVFSVLVTPTAAGSLQLQVPAGAVLTDASGNALDTSVAIVDDTVITVDAGGDTTPPTLAGSDIVDDAAGGPVAENTLVTYIVTFSEDMDAATVTSADFANAGTAPVSFGTVSETSPGVFSVLVTPTAAGSLQLQVHAGAALADASGNALDTTVAIVDDTLITVNGPAPLGYGGLILGENFESPLVVGFDDNTVPDNGLWVGSSQGFGATNRGLSNETVVWPATTLFTTPYGKQGYKLNYSNSGLTTAQNVLGEVLQEGVPYTVKFNVATEAGAGDATYNVQLVAFEASDTDSVRNDVRGGGVGTVLASVTGTVTTTDMSHADQLTFTAAAGDPSLGKEIGLRLMNGNGPETYDHIVFFKGHDLNPSPEIGVTRLGGNVPLSWTNFTPNTGTDVWVDVWFGTDPQALSQVVSAGLNTATTTVNVPGAGTYYWRVDSYLDGSSTGDPQFGDVFYFTVIDTDSDGFPDDYELANTNPPSATALNPGDDLDNDSLTNADEYYYGTDPNNDDSDGDTLMDGPELSGVGLRPVTSPVEFDTDNDGLSDGVETNTGVWVGAADSGTNPADNDWDKDGIKDGAETNTGTLVDRFNTGTNPYVSDTDDDGAGDYYEVNASFTDPFNAADKPAVPYPLPDPDGSTGVTNKPVKVYIMAGQSNMVGIGYTDDVNKPGSLEAITKVDNKFPNFIDASNNWTQRQDVLYKGVVSANQNPGPLTAGQGGEGNRVGPELGFGHVMGYYHDEPVLLLKASQGNRSLAWDFCPPSVTSTWDFSDGNTYAGYGDSPYKWTTGSTPVPALNWYAGKQYDDCFRNEADMGTKAAWISGNTYNTNWLVKHNGVMYLCSGNHTADPTTEPGVGAGWTTVWSVYSIENAHDVLANFSANYPQWAAQGYEIAGFVWWQGHRDGGEVRTGTAGAYASKYEDNLVELIQCLRTDFNAPTAPVVVATVGFGGGGWAAGSSGDVIYNAQLAVGDPVQHPAFDGNVKSVDTTGYWRETNESPGEQGFHYNNNAETYTLVGDAMARAMIDLVGAGGAPDATPPTLAGSDIVDDAAGGPVDVNTLVTYTVSFNEDMQASSVDAADFENGGTAPVTIGSVTETSPGVFTVLATPTGSGSLQLQVVAGAVLNDTAGNPLNTSTAIADDTTITVNATVQITVPNVVGLAQATAEADIVAANLVVGMVTNQSSITVPAGDVISQNPTGGSTVSEGTGVDLVVSSGPPMTTVPNVVGQPQAAAEANIVATNLVVGTVTSQNDDTVPAGNVISQSPTGGASVLEGSSVNLVVSLGPVMTTVPDVVGLAQVTAEANITGASLVVGTVTQQYDETVPDGDVISQSPSGGASAAEGSSVDLVVSQGPAPSPKLVRMVVSGVTNTGWTTVNLGQTYTSLVAVATPIYAPGVTVPVVVRLDNVTSAGFDLKLDRADGLLSAVSFDVSVIAVEEGTYDIATHGVKMEAVKYTSTITANGPNAWNSEARSYLNSYTTPVVIGQVMSSNDSSWSVFWSMGATRQDAVDAANLNVGKHVGQDPNEVRADEVVGYIVIEAGNGTIDGVAYEAGLGPATVQCFGDSASPFSYALGGSLSSVTTAVASQSGMSGNDGAWAVLSGSPYATTTSLNLHVAEDSLKDSRQRHSAERVGYIVFE